MRISGPKGREEAGEQGTDRRGVLDGGGEDVRRLFLGDDVAVDGETADAVVWRGLGEGEGCEGEGGEGEEMHFGWFGTVGET